MHKHVQARCQLKELFGSIIYSATDFLVVPKAILPRRVLSMVDFCVGHLHLHASCWHLAAAAGSMVIINDLNTSTTSCLAHHLHAKSIKKPTIPGGTSLEGGISSAFSNIINMRQEIANLLCFIFIHVCMQHKPPG